MIIIGIITLILAFLGNRIIQPIHHIRFVVFILITGLLLQVYLVNDTIPLYHYLYQQSNLQIYIDSVLYVVAIGTMISSASVTLYCIRSEYPLIILFIVLGVSIMISSNDLISMYLSLELQSFALYILACIYTHSTSSVQASLKYFLLGAISSAFILLGISILYKIIGTTSFKAINTIVNTSPGAAA